MSSICQIQSRHSLIAIALRFSSHEKNLLFMIESFKVLIESLDESSVQPVFVFAGDGPARPALEENCRSRNIPAIFMGHLSGEHLAKCYASADIFA